MYVRAPTSTLPPFLPRPRRACACFKAIDSSSITCARSSSASPTPNDAVLEEQPTESANGLERKWAQPALQQSLVGSTLGDRVCVLYCRSSRCGCEGVPQGHYFVTPKVRMHIREGTTHRTAKAVYRCGGLGYFSSLVRMRRTLV